MVTLIVASIVAFAAIYLAISIPAVQNKLKQIGEEELSKMLHTEVTVESLSFEPFNELILNGVNIPDQEGNHLFSIDKLAAGISIYNLISNQKLVFTYAEVIGLDATVTRPDKDSPTSMQFIIDALKPKPGNPPSKYDIKVFNIVIRKSNLSYDVESEPYETSKFNPNHISIKNLKADLALPRIKNNDFVIRIERFSFSEQSGFQLSNLKSLIEICDTSLAVSDLVVELPNSRISPDNIRLSYSSLQNIATDLKTAQVHLTLNDNHLTPSDFAAFEPKLASLSSSAKINLNISGTANDLTISKFNVKYNGAEVALTGNIEGIIDKQPSWNIPQLTASSPSAEISSLTDAFANLSGKVKEIITNCGNVKLSGSTSGSERSIFFDGNVNTDIGGIKLSGNFEGDKETRFSGHVLTDGFNVGGLIGNQLGELALDGQIDLIIRSGKVQSASVEGIIPYVDFRNYRYNDITADVTFNGKDLAGTLIMADENANVRIDGDAIINKENSAVNVNMEVRDIDLAKLNLTDKFSNKKLSASIVTSLTGNNIENVKGDLTLNNLVFADENNKGLHINSIKINTDNTSSPQYLNLTSDFLSVNLTGSYDYKSIAEDVKEIIGVAMPTLIKGYTGSKSVTSKRSNDLSLNVTIWPCDELEALLNLPVSIADKTSITGSLSDTNNSLHLSLRAPYLIQGNKIIENTVILVDKENDENNINAKISTIYPLKSGKVDVSLNVNGVNDRLDTDIKWAMRREHDYSGSLSASTLFTGYSNNKLNAIVNVNPTTMAFNDTVWHVSNGVVELNDGVITMTNLRGDSDDQFVDIEGVISHNPEDEVRVTLEKFNLGYLFETLELSNVMIGGRASGTLYGRDLLSGTPQMHIPLLHVDSISYNKAVMGDADVVGDWDHPNKAVEIKADIMQYNDFHSYINGKIFTGCDSLYLDFNANKANISFMKPFMQAFTSDVDGMVSGHAVLYGNFKDINMYGDLYGENLKFKIDYTNVYYTCSDSIHMVPGLISFSDVVVSDRDNHHALLNGWLKHNNFHDPVFDFSITDASELLCYDMSESQSNNWYGTIYGNGSAFVSGEPGIVKINVNMQSAARSKFTFVLSKTANANEYNFITFRDRDKLNQPEVEALIDTIPEIVRILTRKVANQQNNTPSDYLIDLQVDITPDAQMVVIMDPLSGDKIKGTGSGNMRLTYGSRDEKLGMYGKYTIDKGNYTFTLQDIIIKEFTINEGSSISFTGDPYSAVLDINATYAVNTNIRDLDASFAYDEDFNRTSIPVHAILKARGPMNQPEIGFDLSFPTLTSEAHRRVMSIISTDEMMNRQIIYLLALNRFYTPEYTNSNNSNTELTSMASSTISSQLSNMLGQISENWTISPNFRTNTGDFSDIDIDVALSSQLLNNRLLINGNFGYRDNTYSLRSSNFIGDFDIEYLLNRKGTIRLKAYNHFNDQNYFIRNALTTQGVGVVFKHEFNRPFDFLKKKKTTKQNADSTAVNSVSPVEINEK